VRGNLAARRGSFAFLIERIYTMVGYSLMPIVADEELEEECIEWLDEYETAMELL
jgi:hypothetical protein